jgi:hypothetical protein
LIKEIKGFNLLITNVRVISYGAKLALAKGNDSTVGIKVGIVGSICKEGPSTDTLIHQVNLYSLSKFRQIMREGTRTVQLEPCTT